MVVTCDIQFENNPQATFYAGQVITGKVTLTADQIKQVKAVTLKINGSANTRWTESGSKNISDTTYWGHVDYMSTLTNLLVSKTTDQAVFIEPGIHTFSFACHIPVNCPSSLESLKGSVRYIIKVSLVRPWKFDQTFTRGFTVLSVKDLNYSSPLLKLPVNNDISKFFCCGPFKSDPLLINIQLPQSGYVPGQHIPVSILVTNETKARINEICVRLVMIITLFSTHPLQKSITERRTLTKLIGDSVLRQCKKQFNYLLPIPATPPTCSTLCSIIQIAYRVEVEAKIQGIMFANQCIHIPVTIGNVPLQTAGMVVQQQPMPKEFCFENSTQMMGEIGVNNNELLNTCHRNLEPWSEMPNITAPVYMEATDMPQGILFEDIDHDYGEKNFIPKYPVFNIPSSGPPQQSFSGDETDGAVTRPVIMDSDKTTRL